LPDQINERRIRRSVVAALAVLLIAVGFVVSRLSDTRRSVYLIGTPIEQYRHGGESSAGDKRALEQPAVSGSGSDGGPGIQRGMCGAPTRSVRPCQRKVKAPVPCWQHREKLQPTSRPGKSDRVL
jgi:hypothetical protein